jgi:hypothetical protein
VPVILFGGMDRYFGRRQCEDQPSVAGVYGGKSHDVTQKGAVSFCVFAVQDYVGAEDHGCFLSDISASAMLAV